MFVVKLSCYSFIIVLYEIVFLIKKLNVKSGSRCIFKWFKYFFKSLRHRSFPSIVMRFFVRSKTRWTVQTMGFGRLAVYQYTNTRLQCMLCYGFWLGKLLLSDNYNKKNYIKTICKCKDSLRFIIQYRCQNLELYTILLTYISFSFFIFLPMSPCLRRTVIEYKDEKPTVFGNNGKSLKIRV